MRFNFLPIFLRKDEVSDERSQTSAATRREATKMSYLGVYDRTIFYSPDSKFCIINIKTSDQSVPQQARSAYKHRDNLIRFVAMGYELPRTDKVSMLLDGEWKNDKHGFQLQVQKCEEIVPQTEEGVQGYLSSRPIKRVEEKTLR
jgi:exodeoxyribonuclease V alpha subunit